MSPLRRRLWIKSTRKSEDKYSSISLDKEQGGGPGSKTHRQEQNANNNNATHTRKKMLMLDIQYSTVSYTVCPGMANTVYETVWDTVVYKMVVYDSYLRVPKVW